MRSLIPVRFFPGLDGFWGEVVNIGLWAALLAIPIFIILLYFLKLRRRPLEVPSTYLWRRAIEDLHVNSLWQKLKQNWLLFLQLLIMLLVILACLRPGWRGSELQGERFVFLIDASASMSANDVSPTRLEEAKQRVLEDIDRMEEGESAMVISFSDAARVEQSFTTSKSLLKHKVEGVQPTNRTSNIDEALRAAAGLANPQRTSQDITDVQVAEAMPATLMIYSDGGFSAVRGFSLGNLTPKYFPIASEKPANVGIVAFSTERNPETPGQMQAFGRLENYSDEDVTLTAELYLNNEFRDAKQVSVKSMNNAGVQFELSDIDLLQLNRGELKLVIDHKDDFDKDNVAYAALNSPRKARVLLVTAKNDALKLALTTDEAVKLAMVKFAHPSVLEDKPENKKHYDEAGSGVYDLIIYDRCAPRDMPAANTLFIGVLPPKAEVPDGASPDKQKPGGDSETSQAKEEKTESSEAAAKDEDAPRINWSASEKQGPPIIIDVDRVHPLMQLLEMGNVNIVEGFAVTPPQGGSNLIDSDIGPLFAIAPRSGFEDTVLGFEIITQGEDGAYFANTDWPIRRSFPVFVMNVLRYLGGSRGAMASLSTQPGQPMTLRASAPYPKIYVRSPSGEVRPVHREGRGVYIYNDANELGFYDVFEGDGRKDEDIAQQFTVNLFDSRESNLQPAEKLDIEYTLVEGKKPQPEPVRKEAWKWLLLGALGVLGVEWCVYLFKMYR